MTKVARGKTSNTKIVTILHLLKLSYPHANIVLNYHNPWELLVAVILSAQCTDVMVNKVTDRLFKKYRSIEYYVRADIKEFEVDIKSTGFYHNKAKNVLAASRLVQEKFSGKVPETMTELLTLPGVARKTANVVLGNAFGVVEGIAVDTHVLRLSQRLRLVDLDKIGGKKEMFFKRPSFEERILDYQTDADPVKIEQQLMEVIPKKDWFKTTYLLIDHGRAVCKAQNPKCNECILKVICPASRAN